MFISIEIKENIINIIQASKKGEVLSIFNCISIDIPFVTASGRIKDVEGMSILISDALKKHNIHSNKAVFVINADSIITRKIKLPLLKKKQEIMSMLRYELNQLIPVDLSQYQFRYKIIKTKQEKNYALYVVYCVPLNILNQYSKLAKALKLRTVKFDIPCNCINKISQHNLSINHTDILEEVTAFAMLDINKVQFCVLNKVVNDFSITTILDNNYAEIAAESQMNYISEEHSGYDNFVFEWLDEIRKYIRYYNSIDYEIKINKLYIYGSVNIEDDLLQQITGTLNMDVAVLKNISNIDFAYEAVEKGFNINAFFIPLLAAFNDKKDICFRYEKSEALPTRRVVFLLVVTSAFFLVFLNYIIFIKGKEIRNIKEFVADRNNVLLNNEIEVLKKDITYLESILQNIELLKETSDKDDIVCSEIFRYIKYAIPQNTQVASISVDRYNTQINCTSDSMKEVTLFLEKLREIEFIESVYVPSMEVKNDMKYSYSVVCVLKEVFYIDK